MFAGVPLKEAALFLAKSILCSNPSPLADEECRYCKRIEHGTYADFFMLGGEAESIKKDDVQEIVAGFSKTPLEEKGILNPAAYKTLKGNSFVMDIIKEIRDWEVI